MMEAATAKLVKLERKNFKFSLTAWLSVVLHTLVDKCNIQISLSRDHVTSCRRGFLLYLPTFFVLASKPLYSYFRSEKQCTLLCFNSNFYSAHCYDLTINFNQTTSFHLSKEIKT
jgi:hypothetical protein